VFSRDWRPRGLVLVVAESVYTVTDPPLRMLRRVIPPLRFGGVQLDLGYLVLMLLCTFAMRIVGAFAAQLQTVPRRGQPGVAQVKRAHSPLR